MMSIDEIRHIFTRASTARSRYTVTSIQQRGDHWHVRLSSIRAPGSLNHDEHFEDTGLQLLRWGVDCVGGRYLFVMRECETSTRP